jgi:hypothetical protein
VPTKITIVIGNPVNPDEFEKPASGPITVNR